MPSDTIARDLRDEAAANFTSAFPEVDPLRGTPAGRQAEMSEEIRACLDLAIDIDRRLSEVGVPPCSVLNMNPFTLRPDGTVFENGFEIEGAPFPKDFEEALANEKNRVFRFPSEIGLLEGVYKRAIPYRRTILRRYRFSIADRGGAMFIPREHVPSALARECEQQLYAFGGVVSYVGDVAPQDPRAATWKHFDNLNEKRTHEAVMERLKSAFTRMVSNMESLVRIANTSYRAPNRIGFNDVNEAHRRAAMYLHQIGKLAQKPDWIEISRDEASIADPCPVCKKEGAVGAVLCANCGYVWDPAQAYLLGMIEAENNSLRRLKPQVLDELGLDPELSMVDEKGNRKKHASKKGKKQATPDSE